MTYLYRVQRNECVFEVDPQNHPVFHSFALEGQVEDGIDIPNQYRDLFNGREVVHLKDSDFCDAMRVYVRDVLNRRGNDYEWRDTPPQPKK